MKKTGTMAVRQFLGKVKSSQIPMYSQRVQLTTEEVKSPKGSYYIIHFNPLGMRKNMDEILMLEEMAKTYGARVKSQVVESGHPSSELEEEEDFVSDDMPF
jgi:hypothetical protein